MNSIQRSTFNTEIVRAKRHYFSGDLEAGFVHLERAHILGQTEVLPHVTVHWLMFLFELRQRRPAAVVGQAVRIVLGALGSAVGIVPIGNTGGTNISMFKRMPVAQDLQSIIDGRVPSKGSQNSKR